MRGRPADGEYARFVEATLGLASEAEGLPRRARFGVEMTIVRVWESEQIARTALAERIPQRLGPAASEVQNARMMLADAAVDVRRRRSLRPVA